jgi:hypothetical protein
MGLGKGLSGLDSVWTDRWCPFDYAEAEGRDTEPLTRMEVMEVGWGQTNVQGATGKIH